MTNLTLRVGALVAIAMGAGCGLIDSDVANIDLSLPDKNFTIDASGWDVDPAATMALTSTSCAAMPSACDQGAQAACPMDCTGRCGTSSTCELDLDVSLYQLVDLYAEKPELQSINDRAIIDVTIDTMTYTVTANTLNIDTPEMQVFIAPMSIMDPNDPTAEQIGTIPAVAAGTTTMGAVPFQFTAAGKAKLVDIMASFKSPFNILVGSKLTVTSTTPVPTGRLDAVIKIKGHAGL